MDVSQWCNGGAIVGCWLLLAVAPLGLRAEERGTAEAARSQPDAGTTVSAVPQPDPGLIVDFTDRVVPFLKTYCLRCHQGDEANAGIRFERYADEASVRRDRRNWERILQQLRGSGMPPEDEPQPADDERTAVTDWIRSHAFTVVCTGPVSPGRVTIRRLNRTEYNNTVRDLLGVNLSPADEFPADDVGYGFDHIGDVLSLPPVLLERYLRAAEQLARAAIVTGEPGEAPLLEVRGKSLSSVSEVSVGFDCAVTGEYTLRAVASADQAGPDPARMTFRIDGRDLATVDVPVPRDQHQTYEVRARVERGSHQVAVAFINDYYQPDDPDPARRGDRNLHVQTIAVHGPLNVDPDDYPESHKRILFRQPAASAGEEQIRECAASIMRSFAGRAYRRPATDAEVARLVELVRAAQADGDSFPQAVARAVQAVLVSPHFLFRVERDPVAPANARTLDDFELATRLSYFLWSSMPDEELLALAADGALRRENNLDAQVQRMLADPKSRALIQNFAGQWLGLRKLAAFEPDRKQFPQFDDDLRQAMAAETEHFFEAIVREDRSVLDFLDADFTFLNERLAKHYGRDDVTGEELRRVSLDGDARGGLLGHASILTVTSNPTRTSPVKRGKWILENLLAAPPPSPPPDVPELDESGENALTGTLRQRMEQHRAKAACAACHESMDPLGFGLENFDAIGAWRTHDGEFPIDASGTLPGGETFRTPAELRAILKNRHADFRRCLVEKMLTYALGRGLEYDDACTVARIADNLAEAGDRFSALIHEIVQSDPFQMQAARRDPAGEPVHRDEDRGEQDHQEPHDREVSE